MHSLAEQLRFQLIACETFLDTCGERLWRDKLRAILIVDATGNEALDLELLLSYFSEQDAFFQLVLQRDFGHRLDELTEVGANAHLDQLRLDIFYLAQECQRLSQSSLLNLSAAS